MRQGMEKQAGNLEDFGPPFFYSVSTTDGFKPV
jgi:hypothetical protein